VRLSAIFGVTSGLLWIAAGAVATAASPAGAPRSPEVMLYISHSVGGGGGSSHPIFGLRVDQIHQGGNSGDPDGGDAIQHRELVNWQMEAHSNFHISDLRVQLGRRVTYDVTNRSFGSPRSRSSMALGVPTLRGSPSDSGARPALAHASVSAPSNRDAFRDASSHDASGIREMAAAAVAALSPARFTFAQRQTAKRQGGIAAQHYQSAAVAYTGQR
jgi:hypothetical protein